MPVISVISDCDVNLEMKLLDEVIERIVNFKDYEVR